MVFNILTPDQYFILRFKELADEIIELSGLEIIHDPMHLIYETKNCIYFQCCGKPNFGKHSYN